MTNNSITSITIHSRGRNCDEFGNPYIAYKAIIKKQYVSFMDTIIVLRSMTSYDSYEKACLECAVNGINEALGTDIKMTDPRIKHYHKKVYRDADLEHPENWKV